MKTRNIILIVLMVAGLWSSCREVTTTTRIFPDGTCERIIEAKGDSAEIADPALALPYDRAWTLRADEFDRARPLETVSGDSSWTISRKLKDDNEIEYKARRRFPDAAAMEAMLQKSGRDSLRLDYRFRVQRRFRWFSTVYRYSETVLPINPFLHVPISDYLSEEEIRLYSSDEDTMDLDDKVDAWGEAAVFEEFYTMLRKRVDHHPISGLSVGLLEQKKESLRNALDWSDIEGVDNEAVMEACRRVLDLTGTEAFEAVFSEILEIIRQKIDFLLGIVLTDFVFKAEMPGLIIGTNASAIEGNRAIWGLEGTPFLFRPFEMRVESRRLNGWALWVSGAFLVIIIVTMAGVLLKRAKASDG